VTGMMPACNFAMMNALSILPSLHHNRKEACGIHML
jgi:hypothetical protein